MNTDLLEQFHNKSLDVKNQISNFRKIPVQLSKINKSGRVLLYEGQRISAFALNDLLNFFSIKNDLLGEIHDDEKQWLPLQKCLSDIKNDKIVTGITKQEGNNRVIIKFVKENIKEESGLNMEHGFNLLQSYLETAEQNVTLHQLRFNEENLALEGFFKDTTSQIDVFGDNKDIWNSGFSFVYGLRKTVVSPFLLRLACSNGMVVVHRFSRRYFTNKGLRQKSFNRLIKNTLSSDLRTTTIQSCERMKQNNASLREFFNARDTCLSISKELADTYFNDEQIQEAYKPYRLRYRNSRWLSSANSNINSYEFFNRLTHCISHQSSLPQWVGIQLNYQASEMFFKGPDLSFQAPNPFLK